MNEILERLAYLETKTNTTSNNDNRNLMISDYMMLIRFFKDIGKIDEQTYKSYSYRFDKTSYTNFLQESILKYQNELILNNQELINIISKMKSLYLEIDLEREAFVDDINYSLLVESFFKEIGDDVLNLYYKMKSNRIISITSDDEKINYGGWCYEQKMGEPSYILIKSPDKISEISSLIHEMGHAYNCYLLKNHLTYTRCNIIGEVMSLLFEKMYLKFLKKHNIHTDYLWYEYYLCLYDSVFTSYIICILISDNKLELNPYNLICKSIYDNKKLVEIAKQHNCWLEDDCVLNLDSFSYVISDIISDYFLKIIEIDYNKGFLLLCEFIKEREKYSIKEIIDKYTKDLSYTETSIKNVIEKGKIYQKNVFLE